MSQFEITLDNYKNESSNDINAFIGKTVFQLIINNPSNNTIYEYDTQIIDKQIILQLVDTHYLLVNKIYIKNFYSYWQKRFVDALSNDQDHSEDLTSICLLLVNPNFASAWSRRKAIVMSSSKDQALIRRELDFNKLILKKHFKCEQAYVHRRWLVKHLQYTTYFNEEFCLEEMKFIYQELSKKVKANYYCWTYLNWFLERLLVTSSNMDKIVKDAAMDLTNLLYVNPSDYCLFHSRLNLISVLTREGKINLLFDCDFVGFVFHEFEICEDLVLRYPDYTTVWNYRKYLYFYLFNLEATKRVERDCIVKLVDDLNRSFIKNVKTKYLIEQELVVEFEVEGVGENLLRVLIDRDFVISKLIVDVCGMTRTLTRGDTTRINAMKYQQFLKEFFPC